MSLVPGTRLGAYEVVALLEAGGMGEVYRARAARPSVSPARPPTTPAPATQSA
jgi:hypothetical protein